MTAALGAVRFAAEAQESTDEVLNMVNFRLNKDIQNHMFVALFYGILDPETRKLYYTNAGQTMPFLLRNGEIDFLPQAEKTDRFPLGIVKATVYEQLSIELQPGDMLIHYTDGIVDVMNGSHETYGFDRLAESIRQNASLPPSELIDKLIAEMKQYSPDSNIEDDVTLVVLKFEWAHFVKETKSIKSTNVHGGFLFADTNSIESESFRLGKVLIFWEGFCGSQWILCLFWSTMSEKQKIIEVHIPSVMGYEKVAMESAAAAAKIMGFHTSRIEDLKTAISEACSNAMEHGNQFKKDTTVLVTLKMDKESLEVNVKDEGRGLNKKVKVPKIEKQINGIDDPRGWGMFLIKNLVDEVEMKKIPRGGNVTRMVIHVNRWKLFVKFLSPTLHYLVKIY